MCFGGAACADVLKCANFADMCRAHVLFLLLTLLGSGLQAQGKVYDFHINIRADWKLYLVFVRVKLLYYYMTNKIRMTFAKYWHVFVHLHPSGVEIRSPRLSFGIRRETHICGDASLTNTNYARLPPSKMKDGGSSSNK